AGGARRAAPPPGRRDRAAPGDGAVRFLLEVSPRSLDELVEAGAAARDGGLDGVLLTATEALPAPLIAAAALAGRVDGIRIAAEVDTGDRHPIELAEEAAVTDLASGGRLILVA